jgi:hypothetical protein
VITDELIEVILEKIKFVLSEPDDMTREYLEQIEQDIELELSNKNTKHT